MELARNIDGAPLLPDSFVRWFAQRGWSPRAHQLELLAKAREGRSSLLIAPTGGGKTLAGFLPTLVELSERNVLPKKLQSTGRSVARSQGLHTLYISPLKALAVDIARNLETPVREMGLPIRLETRTGDTPASKRMRQRRDPPDILLTTPEQLALLLATAETTPRCTRALTEVEKFQQLGGVARRLVVGGRQVEDLARGHGEPDAASLEQCAGARHHLAVIAHRIEPV